MSLKDAYIEVAERYLQSSRASLTQLIQESATFQAYHAFESLGGALATSYNRYYPLSHVKKLNVFTNTSRGKSYGIAVSQLAIQLKSLRNSCLYPETQPNGQILRPRHRLSQTQSSNLISRIGGLLNRIQRDL